MTVLDEFLIGGFTVAGITYFANIMNNPILAGVIAAIPIGMPTSIFVHDHKVKEYSYNLLMMSFILILVTAQFWYLLNKMDFDKYDAVKYSMLTWSVFGLLYTYM